MSRGITVEQFQDVAEPTVVDVREAGEFESGHIPGAVDVPLERLGALADTLPTDHDLVLVCASGERSERGASLLNERGIDAVYLEGGMRAYEDFGLPVEPEARTVE